MLTENERALLPRCETHVRELAAIYESGCTRSGHIHKDLCAIEHLLRPASTAARIRWVDDIRQALSDLGGKAHLSRIETAVCRLRLAAGRSWPKNAAACIRYTVEIHSADSLNYRQGPDLFAMVDRGSGYWKLK